jgi:hypothetical protein
VYFLLLLEVVSGLISRSLLHPIKKWASELNRTFSKEIQMAKKTHEKMLTISSNKGNAN